MVSARRLSVAVAAVCFPLIALAQEIPNWASPPYWGTSAALQKPEKSDSNSARIGVESLETVPTPPLPFTGINPCRIADTRGNGFIGTYGPPPLVAGVPRSFTLTGQCGIAGTAQAVSLNVTVTNTQGAGHIVIYPQGGVQPTVSTLNYVGGQTIANAAVVPLGTAGGITVVAGVSGTDLILDTNGYYAPQAVVNTVNGLSGAVTLAEGTNITITPSGQTLTIASTAPAEWSLTGNAGTAPGTNFLGTTDNQALELKVNGQRGFRVEPNAFSPNVIGGGSANNVTSGVAGATIGGGGNPAVGNLVTDNLGTVGGGQFNQAGDNAGSLADRSYATVSGGSSNTAGGFGSTVSGGTQNTASGFFATVPGGGFNTAQGTSSFAGGRQAKANHDGAFVWGDLTVADIASTGVNQFIVRASGGMWLGTTSSPSLNIATDFLNTSTGAHLTIGGIWTNNSDRASKEDFEAVDGRELLSRVANLPISKWSYKSEDRSIRHIGPVAQDFAGAFGLGSDDRSITTLDAEGVALASIQALYEIVREKDCEIELLKTRLSKLEAKLP
jgi:hypothetical protein